MKSEKLINIIFNKVINYLHILSHLDLESKGLNEISFHNEMLRSDSKFIHNYIPFPFRPSRKMLSLFNGDWLTRDTR